MSLHVTLLVEITVFCDLILLCICQYVSVTGLPFQIISSSKPTLNMVGVHISSAFDAVLKDPQHCCASH